ncbi:NADP-dependent oxidoreductase [Kitasatospora sp. NPDC057223]|uniref:NADP-dependent oxidoreductase n=1 Tax=Kitasatospora sp. NPDC057223 TaxID=3346055 RepID=UPI003640C55A
MSKQDQKQDRASEQQMYAITQRALGGPEVLERTVTARPVPGPGEILVRVRAAGLNPVDLAVRAGHFPLLGEPPFSLGWDAAGTVEEVGAGVTRFAAGDEVFGMPGFPQAGNAYAEYLAAPAAQFELRPGVLPVTEAGALPLSGLTAYQALVGIAQVGPGRRVLVHAASGGVGHLAVQIAKARGAYVIGTARGEKHALLKALGADELIDHTLTAFDTAVRDVDVVFDLVGGEYARRSAAVLRPGGLIVSAMGHNPGLTPEEAQQLGVRFEVMSVRPSEPDLAALRGLVEAGLLRVNVGLTLPLADAAQAHRTAAEGGVTGKLVLVP